MPQNVKSIFIGVILLTKGNTDVIIVTLTEKATLTTPYYLFVFTSQTTGQVVKFVGTEQSTHTNRYNQFTITTNTYFGSSQTGEWDYIIYEQTSNSNTDIANTTGIVEKGIMQLVGSDYTVTEHTPAMAEIKVHNPA